MQNNRIVHLALAFALALAAPAGSAVAGTLRGSPASMRHQFAVAKQEGVALLRTPADVSAQLAERKLERVQPNESFVLSNVSYPFARPEVRLFIERLATQYRATFGEPLVVTSLTRPSSKQPRNAHPLSVHPAGLAVDLRVPATEMQREWLDTTLLSLEDQGVLDVTRERNPPHYHVAIFPDEYRAYVDTRVANERRVAAATRDSAMTVQALPPSEETGGDRGALIVFAVAAAVVAAGVIAGRFSV